MTVKSGTFYGGLRIVTTFARSVFFAVRSYALVADERGTRLLMKNIMFAGRSARRRMKYGNQSVPNGM